MSFYLVAAFGGPVIGPISGSFLAAATTYKWIFWLLTIFAGVSFVAGALVYLKPTSLIVWADKPFRLSGALVPETYAPVRLGHLAAKLTNTTGYEHRSARAPASVVSVAGTLRLSLVRPFQMLFQEAIVTFFAIYSGFICKHIHYHDYTRM